MPYKVKYPFIQYLKLLFIKGNDLYSYIGFFFFILTAIFAGIVKYVNFGNAFLQNIILIFPVLLLFIILLYSSFKVWLDQAKDDIGKIKLSLLSNKIFSQENEVSLHPDSTGLFCFNINISCETTSDITVNEFKLEGIEPLNKFYINRYSTRLFDCQNNHIEFYLPKKIQKGTSEQYYVKFSFASIPFSRDESRNKDSPDHIIKFANELKFAVDFEITLILIYICKGNVLEEKVSAIVKLSDLRNSFKKKWTDKGWYQAVNIIDKYND